MASLDFMKNAVSSNHTSMATNKEFGRTAFDLLSEIIGSRKIFFFLALIASSLIGFIGWTHIAANPGSEISLLWGLARYKKSDETPRTTPPAVVHMKLSNYTLPQEEEYYNFVSNSQKGFKKFPILDGAINFYCNDQEVVLGGAEVSKISVAGKSDTGEKLNARKDPKTGNIVLQLNSDIAFVELGYKGNLFEIKIYAQGELPGRFWINRISQGSLELSEYRSL